MQRGLPVIASDLGAFAEVVGLRRIRLDSGKAK
jgi:hypothetical protein